MDDTKSTPSTDDLLKKYFLHPQTYLKDFYSNLDNEVAMKMVLTLVPGIVYRLKEKLNRNQQDINRVVTRLLDIGSGPTIHVPICFRDIIDEFYLSDYFETNRNILLDWWKQRNYNFSWEPTLKVIASTEGLTIESKILNDMENKARQKVCQILSCDVTNLNIITEDKFDQNQKFDVITSLFCIEYAVKDMEQYKEIIKKVVALLKPNGYLILSGALWTNYWKSDDTTFPCLYLTEDSLLSSLSNAGIDVGVITGNNSFYYWNNGNAYLIFAEKKSY